MRCPSEIQAATRLNNNIAARFKNVVGQNRLCLSLAHQEDSRRGKQGRKTLAVMCEGAKQDIHCMLMQISSNAPPPKKNHALEASEEIGTCQIFPQAFGRCLFFGGGYLKAPRTRARVVLSPSS